MNIGTLNRDLYGTLLMAAPRIHRNIQLVALDRSDDKNAPTHRIVTFENGNTIEYGAAWEKTKDGRTYYSCSIDQPAYPQPLSFAAFPQKDDEGYDLIWSRKKAAA